MAYTSEDLAALQAAVATGAQRVRFEDGREVQYRSLAEMNQIIQSIQTAIGSTAAARKHSVAGF